MIKKVYIDTSVYGGYFDSLFESDTKVFFDTLIERNIQVLISDILEVELYRAPDRIIDFYEGIPDELKLRVEENESTKTLANSYIEEKVVGKTSMADCEHIALATIYNADVLVSWNFKHIVNLERIRGYNSINFREGYQMIEIRTPNEIFNYG